MLHQVETMDGRSRRLARRAVLTAMLLALAGSGFGLAVAVPLGKVTGIETWLVGSCFLFSGAVLAAFFLLPADRFHHIALTAIAYFLFYLCAGVLLSLYSPHSQLNVLVYLLWFFPLLAFNILMRAARPGRLLHLAILAAPFVILIANAPQILATYSTDLQSIFVVYGLSYLSFGLILSTLSQYREAFIAERERTEALLGASQILESISDCFLSLDREFRLLYANSAAWRELGVGTGAEAVRQALGRPLAELSPRFAAGTIASGLRQAASGAAALQFEARDETAGQWFDFHCFPRSDGLSVYFRNITETVTIREELRRNEQLLRIASRMGRIGGWEADLRGDAVTWSEEVAAIHGTGGRRVFAIHEALQFYTPESRERVSQVMARCRRSGRPFDIEAQLVERPAAPTWVRIMGQPVRDAGGGASRIQGAIQDITERKRAGQLLQEQAELLDKAQDAIVVRGLDNRIRYWNRGAERLYGWSVAEVEGRRLDELLQDEPAVFAAAMAALLGHGEWGGELRQQRKDGTGLTVEARWTLVRDEHGRPKSILAIQTDISARLAVERQLRQSQRLQAVGQLTGGVAHDFNNLLTVILGNSDILVDGLRQHPRLLPLAEMTLVAAQRASELTSRLLSFARQQALEPRVTDVSGLLAGMQGLLRRTLGEDVELRLAHGGSLWPALVDPPQLEAAILNLCINARDAMPDGGRLTVEVDNIQLDRSYADGNEEVAPGDYVAIAVSDTGTGMPAEVAARAFEPFFTTKAVGQGSGLGLSMVFGFAKQSRGHVAIYSEPGQGTTVRLYLPRAVGEEVAASAPQAEAADAGGNERILLVEDDELVRRHVAGQLEALGYRVLAAADGPSALALLQAQPGIDLLFTDVVMPGGMNGRQLAEAALALRPDLPVLFTSGYAENAIVHHGRLDPGAYLLNKPYRLADLADKLRQVLEAHRAGRQTAPGGLAEGTAGRRAVGGPTSQ